jgi:hypothetical protein
VLELGGEACAPGFKKSPSLPRLIFRLSVFFLSIQKMKHEKYNIEQKYKIIKLEDHINSQRMNFVLCFKIF